MPSLSDLLTNLTRNGARLGAVFGRELMRQRTSSRPTGEKPTKGVPELGVGGVPHAAVEALTLLSFVVKNCNNCSAFGHDASSRHDRIDGRPQFATGTSLSFYLVSPDIHSFTMGELSIRGALLSPTRNIIVLGCSQGSSLKATCLSFCLAAIFIEPWI